MPKGPKGEKRPADVNGRAVMIAKIATSEIDDMTTDDGKNAAAVALGRMGGKARARVLLENFRIADASAQRLDRTMSRLIHHFEDRGATLGGTRQKP